MIENVYIVRLRHRPDRPDSYVESHIVVATTRENAKADVQAKVARMERGQPERTRPNFIDVITVGSVKVEPFQVGTVNTGIWGDRGAGIYSDNDNDDREIAVAQSLAEVGVTYPGRRRDFENALLIRGYKVVDAKTGR